MTEDERLLALQVTSDPIAYRLYNPAQRRFVEAVKVEEGLSIVIAIMGNGAGKSFALISILSACIYGSQKPLFARPPFGPQHWPYATKDLRLVSNAPSLEDNGPIQSAIKKLFPWGRYERGKSSGKGYYSHLESDNGYTVDFMTYGQSSKDFASATKSAIFFSEPPPEDIFTECATRLRGRGLLVIEMTPLTYAAWVKHRLVDPGWLKIDGKKVAKVHVVRGEIEDNCKDHNIGGQLSHAQIESQIALWPPAEREARKKGLFMALAGLIYPNWGDANEMEHFPQYHQECWDMGKYKLIFVVDPHDRKPFAMAWFAVFPNSDVVAVAEWPAEDYESFTASPVNDINAYRSIILATEAEIGRPADRRLIDPNFGNAPKAGQGESVKTMFADACQECKNKYPRGEEHKALAECKHKMYFEDPPDAIESGHIRVRAAIGDESKGIRPKLFAMKDCRNFWFGMRSYSYRENKDQTKGLSLIAQLQAKDYPDLVRYVANAGLMQWQDEPEPMELWKPKLRGNRLSAT